MSAAPGAGERTAEMVARYSETPGDESWLACKTGDCPHRTQAECDAWLDGWRKGTLSAEPERAAGEGRWIPCSLRLPEARGWVIAYSPSLGVRPALYAPDHDAPSTWLEVADTTHWMPLPSAPEQPLTAEVPHV